MVIFGGIDKNLNRLNDTWVFDLIKLRWNQIVVKITDFYMPRVRSGHSASIYGDNYLVVFGGMTAVTKELDDVCVLDLLSFEWTQITEAKQTKIPERPQSAVINKLGKILRRNIHNKMGSGQSNTSSPAKFDNNNPY
jgi:hypothetical protein